MENENSVARSGNWFRNIFKVNEDAADKPRTWVRRLGKVVARVSIALMALYLVASVAWKFSGSNKWELVEERNGVKIYSLKAPGANLIQVKGVVRIRSTLGGIMKLIEDPAACREYGCYDPVTIQRVDQWLEYGSFKISLPFPYQPREFLVRQQIHQDPRTKELLVIFSAAPDKAPPDDCCHRVTDMNNTWRLTPLESGEIEFEYIQNMDEGGLMPDLLINTRRPKVVMNILSKLQGMVNRKNFQNEKVGFIKELNEP